MNGSAGTGDIDPQGLARAYDAFIAARWRGDDESADAGTTWFEAHWTGQAPPEPSDPPDAASVLGAAGRGIRWYARGGLVLGYAGQAGGCYQVAPGESVPAPRDPWEWESRPRPDEDRVLRHEGAAPRGSARSPARGEILLDERVPRPRDGRERSRE